MAQRESVLRERQVLLEETCKTFNWSTQLRKKTTTQMMIEPISRLAYCRIPKAGYSLHKNNQKRFSNKESL